MKRWETDQRESAQIGAGCGCGEEAGAKEDPEDQKKNPVRVEYMASSIKEWEENKARS